MRPHHHGHHERRIADRSRHRPDVKHAAEGFDCGVVRHRAERSLEADDPAAGGRDAHRASVIGADRERPHAGGDCGRGTAARSARRAIELPRVACDTPERAVVESLVTELAHRRHADRDRARGLQALHRDCIAVRDVLLEHVGAVGEAHAFGRDHVLHRERHAVQGTEPAARRDLALGAFCRRERELRINYGVGVECGLQPFDAGEKRLHELDRRQLLAPDAHRELRRRREAEIFLVDAVVTLYSPVMAGLVPAIHAFKCRMTQAWIQRRPASVR